MKQNPTPRPFWVLRISIFLVFSGLVVQFEEWMVQCVCMDFLQYSDHFRFNNLVSRSLGSRLPDTYQTSHLSTGFIFEPRGQLKSSANSLLLLKGPFTLNIPGECAPVLILFSRALSLYLEHQVLAADIQNI